VGAQALWGGKMELVGVLHGECMESDRRWFPLGWSGTSSRGKWAHELAGEGGGISGRETSSKKGVLRGGVDGLSEVGGQGILTWTGVLLVSSLAPYGKDELSKMKSRDLTTVLFSRSQRQNPVPLGR
jgi:hypothetical protein